MLDPKQIKALDKAYQKQIKSGIRIRPGQTEDMEGVLTEKLVTPSGAHVLCFSDGAETASVFVSEPIYARFRVGQRCAITRSGHALIGIAHASDPACEKDARISEQQTVTVTVRTRGEACELTDEQISEWYREHVESLLDPSIGEYTVSVSVQRERMP